jgi:CRP/FNR family transcriptional regulator
MLKTATPTVAPTFVRRAPAAIPSPLSSTDAAANQRASQHIADTLKLLNDVLVPQRRVVHAGDVVYQAGERERRGEWWR